MHGLNVTEMRKAYEFVVDSNAFCPLPIDYTVAAAESC